MKRENLPRRRPLLGVLLLLVSLLVAGSVLCSPPWPGSGPVAGLPEDACGMVGRVTALFLLGYLGIPLAIWTLCLGFAIGSRLLFLRPVRPWGTLAWIGGTALALSLFAGSIGGSVRWGVTPLGISGTLAARTVLGPWGSGMLTGGLLLVFVLLALRRVPVGVWRGARRAFEGGIRFAALLFRLVRRIPLPRPGRLLARLRRLELHAPWEKGGDLEEVEEPGAVPEPEEPRISRELRPHPGGGSGTALSGGPGTLGTSEENEDARLAEAIEESLGAEALETGPEEGAREPERDPLPRRRPRPQGRPADYILPPIELLEVPEQPQGTVSREEVLEKSRVLVRTLLDFGIEGRIGEVHPGPVITQYEYEPAAGVRISQIVSRADDLALALRASRIRLVAPIPGKAAIGIEVPNRQAELIAFRSVIQESDLGSLRGHLPLFLGRDIRGRPQYWRLEQMPHLLVAGTTGSGKSVCLNTCIFSLLFRRTPEELRLLLIDPKMLELTGYDGIPHLLCPVVTDARMAARMLQWMVSEMERRYRKMATIGVRNIEGYREKAARAHSAAEALEPMPFIVVVVDELADLMLTLANEIEGPIARLAQMARAVGIHLVLATQRPSVDVITGVIKANFPARIAFQVASKVDSRTILDTNGAESLLGRGDMLFIPPGQGSPVRLHGAFVSDRDAESLVSFLRQLPEPEPIFREEILSNEGSAGEIDDDLFEDALRLVVFQKQASTSFLQRRLKVGYSRAGRLMDLLEAAGAVGPAEGSKPREVLADEAFLEDWLAKEKAGAGSSS
jgi:S-DNA-T family DNA segregation ATPase FtsK/SpoIIIE